MSLCCIHVRIFVTYVCILSICVCVYECEHLCVCMCMCECACVHVYMCVLFQGSLKTSPKGEDVSDLICVNLQQVSGCGMVLWWGGQKRKGCLCLACGGWVA